MTDTRTQVDAALDQLRPELAGLAASLYEHPEIGFAEHRSVRTIADVLAQHGYATEIGAFGVETSFIASVGNAEAPHFAIIAEYDALPGIGQACGHNVIAGIAVGAFLAAAPLVAQHVGRLSIIGTPAEENGGGKEVLIQAGAFHNIDAAGMVHPSSGQSASSVLGPRSTGVRRVAVTYRGRASHAAGSPWLGRNALDGVVTAYQGVAQLRQHILPTDRIHGIITDGGAAPNIVPEHASALFYVRSAEVESLRELTDRVVAVLEGAAQITGTRAEIDLDPVPPYLPLRTNPTLSKVWTDAISARGVEVADPAAPARTGPSTDMGNVSLLIPSIQPTIGLGTTGAVAPHEAGFAEVTVSEPATDALVSAASALAQTALTYLADAELRTRVQAEFDADGGIVRWES